MMLLCGPKFKFLRFQRIANTFASTSGMIERVVAESDVARTLRSLPAMSRVKLAGQRQLQRVENKQADFSSGP